MKKRGRFLVLCVVAFSGCSSTPQEELRKLEKASSIELYSLQPFSEETWEANCDPSGPGERLHGWKILGKTKINDEATRRELIDALKKGMVEGHGAACFWPRHAVRRSEGGKTFDLLICFECGHIALYQNGTQVGKYQHIGDGQSSLDDVLRKVGIPLARKRPNSKD